MINCSIKVIGRIIIGIPSERIDARSSVYVRKKVSNGYTSTF
jgi:hypothetical protein